MDWKKSRSGGLFAVACLTSPCCAPMIVPLILALLAGTPVALWITQNIALVYGVLTLISVISFVLAWRWIGKRNPTRHAAVPAIHSSEIPVISSAPVVIGENAHGK